MIECYGASRPQHGRGASEDAFVIGRSPVPWAALCDGAGHSEQAAHRVLRFFQCLVTDGADEIADPAAWRRWVRLMDSHLLEAAESTFVGVAVAEATGAVTGAYVGDSRAYLVHEGEVRLLTAESGHARLGSGAASGLAIGCVLARHDVVLLMSDGAWTPFGGPYLLGRAVAGAATSHFSEMPAAIIEAASRTGCYDDMTVVAIRRG